MLNYLHTMIKHKVLKENFIKTIILNLYKKEQMLSTYKNRCLWYLL